MDEHELGMSPRSALSGIEEDLESIQQHYVHAYSATELKTFHCDRVRKMPLSGLDPSMLIGFFCRDESDWKDFRNKVEEVSNADQSYSSWFYTDMGPSGSKLGKKHKIFLSINDEPPNWPSDSDSNLDLESLSDPEMDLEEPEDSDDDFSLAEEEIRSQPKSRSIRFTGSRSPSTSSPISRSTSESASLRGDGTTEIGEDLQTNGDGKRSSEVETEEESIDPITPHAATFPEQDMLKRPRVKSRENTIPGGFGYEDDDEDEDLGVEGDGDIEDDWVDSGLITPPSVLSSSKSEVGMLRVESVTSEGATTRSKSKSGSKYRDEDRERRPSKSKSRRPDITSKTVPIVETTTAATIGQHYPFPSSITGEAEKEDDKKGDGGKRIPQMRTTKARDGGRTQSGGVRGVLLTDDGDDF
jgi:cysteine protease ATG4